ncbi:hypothetical protein DQW77_02655 [Roseovarius sp. TE539]|nr:hypothetical protein DQW77_02655 [Roseovarius sp. TE539]
MCIISTSIFPEIPGTGGPVLPSNKTGTIRSTETTRFRPREAKPGWRFFVGPSPGQPGIAVSPHQRGVLAGIPETRRVPTCRIPRQSSPGGNASLEIRAGAF